jgi:hypothetical protein
LVSNRTATIAAVRSLSAVVRSLSKDVDRIASAGLIRRFIDPNGRFKFVAAEGYRADPDELRLDMFDAEFTHEGDLCTFEVLIERTNVSDSAL